MKDFKQESGGVSFVTETGEPVNLSWDDFRELEKETALLNTEKEILYWAKEMARYESNLKDIYNRVQEDRELRLDIAREILHSRHIQYVPLSDFEYVINMVSRGEI